MITYEPTAAFAARFTNISYDGIWTTHYRDQLTPISFVGEGVRGRVMFYYLGMGKAYLLDRMAPGWRDRYLDATLDALLGVP